MMSQSKQKQILGLIGWLVMSFAASRVESPPGLLQNSSQRTWPGKKGIDGGQKLST
jgi:hypothetical protein